MNLSDAKKTIAAYMVGDPVAREALEQALQIVRREDSEYAAFLERELDLGADWQSDCAVFLENLAEFSDMDDEERQEEMPELVAHLDVCRSCLMAYWKFRPLWSEGAEPAETGDAGGVVICLADHIRVRVGAAGQLSEHGTGPPSERLVQMAKAAGPLDEAEVVNNVPPTGEAEKQWVLRDDVSGCAFRLTLCGSGSGEVSLRCEFEGQPPEGIGLGDVHLEAREADSGRLREGRPLARLVGGQITLAPINWLIDLRLRLPGGSRRLRIPLALSSDAGSPR